MLVTRKFYFTDTTVFLTENIDYINDNNYFLFIKFMEGGGGGGM
jgi:hypothetical protein